MKKLLMFLYFYLFTSSLNILGKDEIENNYDCPSRIKTNQCKFCLSDSLKVDLLKSNTNNTKESLSLKMFWGDFQISLRNDDKSKIKDILEFPIHAIFPVILKYACECDTLEFIKGQERYEDFDIDKENFFDYYDFIFNDTLKMIILNTSFEDLITKGIWYSDAYEGITYNIFPKNYNVKVKCPNDHLIKLYINNKNKYWSIGFGGL